ncbi:hypothetical protein [Planctomycetes bacterium K23_9]|uniref:hypothetical protein n=1 Tax=Stieleria marina TaxID=1930275 RepID=UPI0011A7B8DD
MAPECLAVLTTPDTQSLVLPTDPAKTKGYTVLFTWNQPKSPGYMAVDIRVKAISTFAADRRLVLRLEPVEGGHSPPQSGMTLDIPISIDQGTKVATVSRLLPKWSTGNGYKIRLFDSNVEREDYSAEIGELLRRSFRSNLKALENENVIDWLIVCEADKRSQVDSFVDQLYPIRNSAVTGRAPQQNPSEVTRKVVSPDELPTDWRGYQAFDAVVFQQSQLRTFKAVRSRQYSALRKWLLCGGTIIVFDAESIASLAEDLDVTPTVSAANAWLVKNASDTVHANYRDALRQLEDAIREIKLEQKRQSANGFFRAYDGVAASLPPGMMSTKPAELQQRIDKMLLKRPDPSQTQRIWLTNVAAGQLIGIDQASDLSEHDLSVVARTFGFRQSPMLRRGVDPLLGDQRVRRWLIPGVAQPPVYTFMGLLTLFVVLVGPVAYRQTTKSGRGYLMFAIAPVLALVTTAMMLIYGVLADGFGTQTRVRQVTWVDGASGDAGERIRGTYFSGVRPVDGIAFAADDEVMVYPDLDDQSWETLNRRNDASMGRVVVTGGGQQFDKKFLPSRAQKQFVVHHPRLNLGRLRMIPRKSADKTPTASNEFDFDLRNVVMRDRKGVYWSIQEMSANQTDVTCDRATQNIASEMLGGLYNDHRPISSTREVNRRSYSSRTRDLISITNRRTGDPSRIVTDGVFEFWLQQNLQVSGELPKGYFIALADISADAIWVPEAQSVASVRFVFGTLP